MKSAQSLSHEPSLSRSITALIAVVVAVTAASLLTGCGKPLDGNVTIQSWQLGGSGAASLKQKSLFASLSKGFLDDLIAPLLGIKEAFAAVSSFSVFSACNDTLKFVDSNGNQISINGNANPSVGQGLLSFSSASSLPMTIGAITIPSGTAIKEIDITFAVVPSVCSGANYAVQFDNGIGGGTINISQNTAFKFQFASPLTVSETPQTISLLFGNIVNDMVSKGNTLNNSTIQSVAVGQAQ